MEEVPPRHSFRRNASNRGIDLPVKYNPPAGPRERVGVGVFDDLREFLYIGNQQIPGQPILSGNRDFSMICLFLLGENGLRRGAPDGDPEQGDPQ